MNAGVIVFLFLLVFSFLGLPIFLSIGVGTVIGALTYGRLAGFFGNLLDK